VVLDGTAVGWLLVFLAGVVRDDDFGALAHLAADIDSHGQNDDEALDNLLE
jgi:hypothetical protein